MNGGGRMNGPVDTTLYNILNVKPNATMDEIKKVYFLLQHEKLVKNKGESIEGE